MKTKMGPGASAHEVLATLESLGRQALDEPNSIHLAVMERTTNDRHFWLVVFWQESILEGVVAKIRDKSLVSQAVFEILKTDRFTPLGTTHYHSQIWAKSDSDGVALREAVRMGVHAVGARLTEVAS